MRLYRDSALAGAAGEGDEWKEDDRRPTALRARPPRGAQRPRAPVLRDLVIGCVVVAIRDSGDELEPRVRSSAAGLGLLSGRDGNRQREARMRQPWLAEGAVGKEKVVSAAGVKDDGGCWGRAARLRGMAVPLTVKDLRPLRGAFGVLDREPRARHRQNGGAGRSLPQQTPRSPPECEGCTFSAPQEVWHTRERLRIGGVRIPS